MAEGDRVRDWLLRLENELPELRIDKARLDWWLRQSGCTRKYLDAARQSAPSAPTPTEREQTEAEPYPHLNALLPPSPTRDELARAIVEMVRTADTPDWRAEDAADVAWDELHRLAALLKERQ